MNKMCIHERVDLKTLIKFVDDRPGHDPDMQLIHQNLIKSYSVGSRKL